MQYLLLIQRIKNSVRQLECSTPKNEYEFCRQWLYNLKREVKMLEIEMDKEEQLNEVERVFDNRNDI